MTGTAPEPGSSTSEDLEVPDPQDTSLGSMDRVAAWLIRLGGEGSVFTKQALRAAIPDVEQIDRRMRDLRKYGWRIDEKRDDGSLASNELRLVEVGYLVWDKAERRKAGLSQVSDRVRQAVFKRDGHACVRCGVAAGEYFDDRSGVRCRLTLAHKYPGMLKATARPADYVTACQRCNESLRQHTDVYRDGDQVFESVSELPRKEKVELLEWMERDARPRSRTDELWGEYRQLSAEERAEVKARLKDNLE